MAFMDRECQRLLDFMEMGLGGNRERFLVVFWAFTFLSPKRCVQSWEGKLLRLGSRALDS